MLEHEGIVCCYLKIIKRYLAFFLAMNICASKANSLVGFRLPYLLLNSVVHSRHECLVDSHALLRQR